MQPNVSMPKRGGGMWNHCRLSFRFVRESVFLYAPAFSISFPLSAGYYPAFKHQPIVNLPSLRMFDANHDSTESVIQRTTEGNQRMISLHNSEGEKKE